MTKTEIQEKIINTIIENNCRGIVLSSVRSGKTRILLKTIERYFKYKNPKIPPFEKLALFYSKKITPEQL